MQQLGLWKGEVATFRCRLLLCVLVVAEVLLAMLVAHQVGFVARGGDSLREHQLGDIVVCLSILTNGRGTGEGLQLLAWIFWSETGVEEEAEICGKAVPYWICVVGVEEVDDDIL